MHLDDRSIQRHLDGYGDPGVERHLRLCAPCSLRAGAIGAQTVRWKRRGLLRRLVRVQGRLEEEQALGRLAAEAAYHRN